MLLYRIVRSFPKEFICRVLSLDRDNATRAVFTVVKGLWTFQHLNLAHV